MPGRHNLYVFSPALPAALTVATIPRLTTSGKEGHAATTQAKSWSFSDFSVARTVCIPVCRGDGFRKCFVDRMLLVAATGFKIPWGNTREGSSPSFGNCARPAHASDGNPVNLILLMALRLLAAAANTGLRCGRLSG